MGKIVLNYLKESNILVHCLSNPFLNSFLNSFLITDDELEQRKRGISNIRN